MKHLVDSDDVILARGDTKAVGISFNSQVFDITPEFPAAIAVFLITFHRVNTAGYILEVTCRRSRDGEIVYHVVHDLERVGYPSEIDEDITMFVDEEIEQIFISLDENVDSENTNEFDRGIYHKFADVPFIDMAMNEFLIYDSFDFLRVCQSQLTFIEGREDKIKEYNDLVNIVYTYYEPSLTYIALKILCDCGIFSSENVFTQQALADNYKKIFGQFWNVSNGSFYYDVNMSPFFGNVFIDPILKTINEKGIYPLQFLDVEVYNNFKNYVQYWLNNVSMEVILETKPNMNKTHPVGP